MPRNRGRIPARSVDGRVDRECPGTHSGTVKVPVSQSYRLPDSLEIRESSDGARQLCPISFEKALCVPMLPQNLGSGSPGTRRKDLDARNRTQHKGRKFEAAGRYGYAHPAFSRWRGPASISRATRIVPDQSLNKITLQVPSYRLRLRVCRVRNEGLIGPVRCHIHNDHVLAWLGGIGRLVATRNTRYLNMKCVGLRHLT